MKNKAIELGRDLLADAGTTGGIASRARRAIHTHCEQALEISLATIDEFVESASGSASSKDDLCENLRGLLRKLASAKAAAPF